MDLTPSILAEFLAGFKQYIGSANGPTISSDAEIRLASFLIDKRAK
jgi:hypothetical protein